MRSRLAQFISLAATVAIVMVVAGPSSALAASPWWQLTSSVRPTVLDPGGEGVVSFRALNVGDASTDGATPVVITATLPAGVTVKKTSGGTPEPEVILYAFPEKNDKSEPSLGSCGEPAPGEVQCTYNPSLGAFEYAEVSITVNVAPGATSGVSAAEVTGGGLERSSLERNLTVGEAHPAFGVEEDGFTIVPEEEGGNIDARAGSHPFQLTTTFALNQNMDTLTPPALARNLQFSLPPGLVANVASFPQCSELAFLTKAPGTGFNDLCPQEAAVGVVVLKLFQTAGLVSAPVQSYPVPVFNLTPAPGEPARFGFYFDGIAVPIDFSVRSGADYGVTATVRNITEIANLISESLTIWGTPGEAVHDEARGWGCLGDHFYQASGTPKCNPSAQVRPPAFLTLPTSCATPFAASVTGESWPTKSAPSGTQLQPASYTLQDSFGRQLGINSCNDLSFGPQIEVAPERPAISTATGLTARIRVPREATENAGSLTSSAVRGITVTLPEGIALNPSGANGLEACSEGLIGFEGRREFVTVPGASLLTFKPYLPGSAAAKEDVALGAASASEETLMPGINFCANAAKVATAKIKTPLLSSPLEGSVYVATQNENPFSSLLAIYLVAEDPQAGVLVKLAGDVELSESGQITTRFENLPQLPFEEAEIHFFSGEPATLATPSRCGGPYVTHASFEPWTGAAAASAESSFMLGAGAPHGTCPGASLPFAPAFTAGSTDPYAGAFSPLTTTIAREDGDQAIRSAQLHMPEGLEGTLVGVALCPEAQANEGTCGPQSQIGEATVSAGVGSDPVTVTGAKVYLTERYGGAPFGLSIASPVKAGPFDLEHDTSNPSQDPPCDCLVVRARVEVDPHSAALTVTTDSTGAHVIPQLVDHIPVELRSIDVTINRQSFTFNPTSCDPLAITAQLTGYEGATAAVSAPYQAVNCALLHFTPKLTVTTAARPSKLDGTSLTFKLSYPAGADGSQSWFQEAKFDIPKQLPARLSTIQQACPTSVFEADPAACPAGSVIGHAVVHTPVLPVPLQGPVYFVSYANLKFPDAILVLQGYGITVDLVGQTFIDKKTGVTSATFAGTPDVPFENVEVTLPSGPTSEFAATLPVSARGSMCAQKLTMPTLLAAQNGLAIHETTPIGVTGCKKKPLTRAQKLAQALKACKKKRGSRRPACIRRARSLYGPRRSRPKSG